MAIDEICKGREHFFQLAREKQGFYKGQRGFYIGTANRGDDAILLDPTFQRDRDELLKRARFWIDELGFPGMDLVDLASIQMCDIIAGPFDDRQTAREILPYLLRVRYIKR